MDRFSRIITHRFRDYKEKSIFDWDDEFADLAEDFVRVRGDPAIAEIPPRSDRTLGKGKIIRAIALAVLESRALGGAQQSRRCGARRRFVRSTKSIID